MIAALADAATTGGITAGGTIFGVVLVLYKAGFFNGNKGITQKDVDDAEEKGRNEGAREANQDAWQKDTTASLSAQLKVLHSIKGGIDRLNEKGE